MLELFQRLAWFFILASAIAYAVFLIGGSIIHRQIANDLQFVLIRDRLRPGEHHLSGMIPVQATCAQLSVKTEEVSPTLFHLSFTTWEEPNVYCVREDTPRAFRAIVFAPAVGVHFIATLDDSPIQIAVLPVTELSSL